MNISNIKINFFSINNSKNEFREMMEIDSDININKDIYEVDKDDELDRGGDEVENLDNDIKNLHKDDKDSNSIIEKEAHKNFLDSDNIIDFYYNNKVCEKNINMETNKEESFKDYESDLDCDDSMFDINKFK